MKRYSVLLQRYPAFYRQDLLDWRRQQLGWTKLDVAEYSKQPEENVRNVFRGKAKNHTVYPVCVTLGLDWRQVHNFQLKKSEFHLAVVTNGNRAG